MKVLDEGVLRQDSPSVAPSLDSTIITTADDDSFWSLSSPPFKSCCQVTRFLTFGGTTGTPSINDLLAQHIDMGEDIIRKLRFLEDDDEQHSTIDTLATSQSSNLSCFETCLADDNHECFDQAIAESCLQASVAEQTSHEMQQVMEWWKKDQEKVQEEALPEKMLADHADWLIRDEPEDSPLSDNCSSDSNPHEEALEQAFLVDMVVERTQAMADTVNRLLAKGPVQITPYPHTLLLRRTIWMCLLLMLMALSLYISSASPSFATIIRLLPMESGIEWKCPAEDHSDFVCKP